MSHCTWLYNYISPSATNTTTDIIQLLSEKPHYYQLEWLAEWHNWMYYLQWMNSLIIWNVLTIMYDRQLYWTFWEFTNHFSLYICMSVITWGCAVHPLELYQPPMAVFCSVIKSKSKIQVYGQYMIWFSLHCKFFIFIIFQYIKLYWKPLVSAASDSLHKTKLIIL